MIPAVEILLTAKAKAVLKRASEFPKRMLWGIADGMRKANAYVVSDIQARRLTGTGPFPVEEQKLGIRTHRLRASLRATTPVIEGNTVTSSIGSNVKYAAIHEFGGVIKRKAHSGTVYLKTDRKGNLKRQKNFQNLAVFARGGHGSADAATGRRAVGYRADAYEIHMPERSPIRTGIAENGATYSRFIRAGVLKELKRP